MKAVIGAVEIGAGIALIIGTGGTGIGAAIGWGLVMAGAGEELAYVADILQGNPALTASAKLPSAPREVVYGETRKGGTFVYQSTTGHQLNEVIVWASKSCEAIVALYVDQRKHYYSDDGTLSQRSPWGGGNGDGNTYTDDSGNNYNFGDQVAAWHSLGRIWDPARGGLSWSAGMTASRAQTGDTASTFETTTIGVAIGSTTYVFACVVPGTAGSSASVFASVAAVGTLVTDGGVTWVNVGPAPGGYWFTQLNNQDSSQWHNDCLLTGHCATYCKFEYDSNLFYGPPQLRATIKGKNDIYDPRSTSRGYTTNWALCIADFLCDPEFGFGVDYATGIDEDQLIAAANICDEQVQLADASVAGRTIPPWAPWTTYNMGDEFTYGGTTWTVGANYVSGAFFGETDFSAGHDTQNPQTPGYSARYTLNGWFNSDQEPGQVLASMLMAAEGRITRQGGVYKIYPAAWYGTTLTFNENDFAGGVKWNPSRKFRERFNAMRGTFVCPQYPYQVVGYDSDHRDPNIFAGEFQPTDAPPYMQDYQHGYGLITDPFQGDANLAQDGGQRLYMDRRYQFVTDANQVQRLMKIFLLRNRFEGTGTFPMKLSALQAQCQDVVNMTFTELGMESTYLEITKFDWVLAEDDAAGGGEGARPVRVTCQLEMQLTDPSIYDWSAAEEMTLFNQPSPAIENAFQVSPPTALSAISSLSTALVAPDGTVTPRIELTWTEPDDPFVTSGGTIQIQITPHSAGTWADVLTLAGVAHIAYLGNVVSGNAYDVRIRGVRPSGAYSVWVEADNIVVGMALNASGLNPVAVAGTLTAVTTGSSTSEIFVAPFTASYGGFTVSCLASTYTLTGESPQQNYWVYYIDPSFAGGAITPIATQNIADFVNKPGYFLIGEILTPPYTSGGGAGRYRPSNYANLGQVAIANPTEAYDDNLSTYALTGGVNYSGTTGFGEALYEDFPAVSSSSGQSLYVSAAGIVYIGGSTAQWAITACLGGGSKPAGRLGTLNARGAWAATTAYALWDTFTESGVTYLVVTGYTSGSSFGSTDVSNTCVLLGTGTGAVGQAYYTAPVPTGTNMSTITVDVTINAPATSGQAVYVGIYEIYIA